MSLSWQDVVSDSYECFETTNVYFIFLFLKFFIFLVLFMASIGF